MNRIHRASSLLFFSLMLLSLFGAERTDSLFLYNGNIVTGEIKKLEYGIMTYKTDDIGTISVKWKDARKLKSDDRFELTLSDHTIVYGSIDTTSNEREIELETEKGKILVNMNELVKVIPIKNSFLSRLDGNMGVSLNYSKGSDILQFGLDGEILYRSFHDQISLSGNSELSRENGRDSAIITKKQDLNLSYNHYFRERWYIQGLFGLSQNTELGLQLRTFLGSAGGKELFQNDLHAFNAGLGILGSREMATDSEDPTYNLESILMLDYKIYKYSYPKVIMTSALYAVPSLSDPGRIRISGKVGVDFEFFKDFLFGIDTYEIYDNRPASEGASNFDWGITTSIGYSF